MATVTRPSSRHQSIQSLVTTRHSFGFRATVPAKYESGDIIDTFVYRLGLVNAQLEPAAAVGLFKSVVSFLLVGSTYYLAYRFGDRRIF